PPADGVESGVAPDEDQPGRRIAGRAVAGPVLERAQAGLLERLLGGVQVAEVTQEGPQGPGPGRSQRQIDPAQLAHVFSTPGRYIWMGRTSKAPLLLEALPSSLAASRAASSEAHSTTKKPRSCSLVSAKGPSSTTASLPLRKVLAVVVGIRRATGPRRPSLAQPSWTAMSLAMTASS